MKNRNITTTSNFEEEKKEMNEKHRTKTKLVAYQREDKAALLTDNQND